MEPEYPMRVSDRGNKGMASSAFLADWLSTHYEPKDETEGEIASKVTFGVHVEFQERAENNPGTFEEALERLPQLHIWDELPSSNFWSLNRIFYLIYQL